jgi:hypothetical protein
LNERRMVVVVVVLRAVHGPYLRRRKDVVSAV